MNNTYRFTDTGELMYEYKLDEFIEDKIQEAVDEATEEKDEIIQSLEDEVQEARDYILDLESDLEEAQDKIKELQERDY